MAMWAKLIKGLIDLVYPKKCLVCKTGLAQAASIDEIACLSCWTKIKTNLPPFCASCGRHLEKKNISKNVCPECTRNKLWFDRAFSATLYEGTMKELIHEFKYKGKDYLGASLSKPMLEFIKVYRLPMDVVDLIIPIPLHVSRLREREFNQACVLGRHIAGEFKKEIRSDILVRHRNTRTQTTLEPKERLHNVRGCFSVARRQAVEGKNILLVDDVITTGSTCSEAARALKEAGSGIVFAMALAN